MILDDDVLLNVTGGGAVNTGLIFGIGAAIAFLISTVEGFFNPTRCN